MLVQRIFMISVFCPIAMWAFAVSAQEPNWDGEWITDLGAMTLEQSGNKVTGTFSKSGTVDGTANGTELSLSYRNGNAKGKGSFEIAADKNSFSGKWNSQGSGGQWLGWRKDPAAEDQETADFSGVWLTSLGTMQLEQDGKKITGTYGSQGWGTVEGEVLGRRLILDWKRIRWSGTAWLEQTQDGKRIFGMTEDDDPSSWIGIRLEGFEHHAPPKAGETVEGRADNGMLYFLRMPDDWKQGESVDLVVLLHGSNWTTRGMVFITAKNWPEIGKRFAILGIQGEKWAKWSDMDDLRFNYTYVNWTGRSTYKGYPFTDRESPYLVMNVIDELDELYSFNRVFVGGHSQGGYLTYVLHMHFPEKLAGTFPVAGGLIIQSEPDVFDDDELKQAQRQTPMAIVHGKQDQVVRFTTGEYNYSRFLAHDYPFVKFISPNMGHPYDFLPIDEAVNYLDMMSTTDVEALENYANEMVAKKNWREVGAAIARAREIEAGKAFSPIWSKFEEAAKKDAEKHLMQISSNRNSKWVDKFMTWQEQFSTANAAKNAIEAFAKLQTEHDETAKELYTEARKAFNARKSDEGWTKYQEIVDKYYAARHYRTLKPMIERRNQ